MSKSKRKIVEKMTVVMLSLFMVSGLLPAKSLIPIVTPLPVKATGSSETDEEKTAYVPLTYTMQSYPKGDDVEYKLTISKKMYPTSSVSFTQIGKGVLTYPIDMNVSVVLGGSLVTKRIQQTVKIDTDTGEFSISDSTIETITGVMDSKTQINVYGESKVPEGKHEVDKNLYEEEYDPKAFFDIGGEDAINQMKMSFVDAITGTEMTTQLSTHMTLWQKNENTGLPILKTLQVIYLFKDIDTCNDDNYTEGTCPEKGDHTFIQTKDSYYFAVDEITRNIFLEQGTQTRYKLKWVSEWSDWNHEETDRVWEDSFPRPDSTSLNQTINKVDYPLSPRIFKKLTLADEEKESLEANEIPLTMTSNGFVSGTETNSSKIDVTNNAGDWNRNDLKFKTENYTSSLLNSASGNWRKNGDIWESTNHSHYSSSTESFSFNLTSSTELSFDWSVSSESVSYDYVYYTLIKNGSTVSGTGSSNKIGGSVGYTNVRRTLDAGNYVLQFTYQKDGSVHSGSDTAYVKNLQLGMNGYSSNSEINEQNIGNSLHSNNHTDNSTSSMSYSFNLTREGTLDFDWQVHSESASTDYGYYTIVKDGSTVSGTGEGTRIGGTSSCILPEQNIEDTNPDAVVPNDEPATSLETMTFNHVNRKLEAGKYTVTFTYKKNATNLGGLDTMFVKDFGIKYTDSYNPNVTSNSMYSTNHDHNTTNTLTYKFKVTRPATMNFDWASSSESVNSDYLYYTLTKNGTTDNTTGISTKIGGSSYGTTTENLIFISNSKKLDVGDYSITFTYRKDGSGHKYLDSGFIRNFSVFYDIIQKPERTDTIWMESNGIWQSNNSTDLSQNAISFEFSIAQTGKLSFDYSVSSDVGDVLSYTLTQNGNILINENSTKLSGTRFGTSVNSLSYLNKTMNLAPGYYSLKFNYKKDNLNTIAGLDKGFIKNLKITEVREVITVAPNTGDSSYLNEYPEKAILLDQRDYKVFWQHIEEGQFQREFSHDWTHKYIFQNTHLGGIGYVQESGHPASGMTIKFAMYAKELKDGNGKSSEYYLVNKVDNFAGNSNLMGDGSWFNGNGKDDASNINGNTIYNTAEKFGSYNKYCDMQYMFSEGCSNRWYDSLNQYTRQNENGNNSCTHFHNKIRDDNNVCASPNTCRTQSINPCSNYVTNGSFSQPDDPDNEGPIRYGSKTANSCDVYRNTGSYRTRQPCHGCEVYQSSCSHCAEYEDYWTTCSRFVGCSSYTCGSKGTTCCREYESYACEKSRCARYETYTRHCCLPLYYEKTAYYSTITYKKDGNNCGWTFPSNSSTLSVLNTNTRAPASSVCGWTLEDEKTSYKHCGYKSATAPTLRTYYFKVNNFTEKTELLNPPFIIQKSDVDQETGRYPLKMTSKYSRGSSALQFDNGWYQSKVNKNSKKNYDKNEIRIDELVEASETWEDYVDAETYREEWRTEYRWKNPIRFDEKYTIDDNEARECATQTGRYSGPIGSCVILEQITTPKYIQQEVTEVLPGSRTSESASNLSIAQVEARADLYAEGQYQLFVYQNTPTKNLAVNNIINSETGFIGQEISTIKLKEDYQDSYVSFDNRKNSIKTSAKTTFLTTFEMWDIYMYIVGHSRYASVSNPAFTLSGKVMIEYPFKFTASNGGIGCGPGLTPPAEGCPLGSEILVTSLLLSNKIANKGMNSLVYTSLDGEVHYDDIINSNDSAITEALCRSPESYYFTVKDYDDVDALVNMIISEQHFNEKPKANHYSNDSYIIKDKYSDDSNVDKLFEFLANLEESDNSPAMQAIKRLEQTNIMELLKTDREIPEETFLEACSILGLEFDSPAELMAYYNKMKNAGLTIESINERYNINITGADLRTYITNYRTSHDDSDVHNRLAFINYETANLVETFGIDGTTQNEKIKELVTKMCNK